MAPYLVFQSLMCIIRRVLYQLFVTGFFSPIQRHSEWFSRWNQWLKWQCVAALQGEGAQDLTSAENETPWASTGEEWGGVSPSSSDWGPA